LTDTMAHHPALATSASTNNFSGQPTYFVIRNLSAIKAGYKPEHQQAESWTVGTELPTVLAKTRTQTQHLLLAPETNPNRAIESSVIKQLCVRWTLDGCYVLGVNVDVLCLLCAPIRISCPCDTLEEFDRSSESFVVWQIGILVVVAWNHTVWLLRWERPAA